MLRTTISSLQVRLTDTWNQICYRLHTSIAFISTAISTSEKWRLKSMTGGILLCRSEDQYPSM